MLGGDGLARELQARLDQQAVIAELGMKALSGMALPELIEHASQQLSKVLNVEYSSVVELRAGDGQLVFRAGTGWPQDGAAGPLADPGIYAPARLTLATAAPVLIDDLVNDERFGKESPLYRVGIVSGICVVIPSSAGAWGVLAALSRQPRHFNEHDVHFVQALANVVGSAAERGRAAEELAHLAVIVESSFDAIFRKDMHGVITTWNAGAQRMYGYTPEEAIGRRVDDLLFPPGMRDTLPEIMRTVREEGSIRLPDTLRVHKDGRLVPISLTVSAIRDQQGEVIGASTIAHDTSERKLAEERLRGAYEELELRVADRTRELSDALKELESFSYAVSHDLRAPLRGIDGFARALLEDYGGGLDERAHHYLGRIIRASDRMAHLIDDLLDLSRLSHGPLRFTQVDLSEMVRQMAGDLREQHPERDVEFVVPDELTVTGDRHLLGIAMGNLLENAWKYTSTRPRARIELGVVPAERGRRAYFVSDNGIGFDMRYSNKLFVPFQRLHGNEVEGTGIGLATVQRVVRRHGGRLWAESRQGEGSTFFFTLSESGRAGGGR